MRKQPAFRNARIIPASIAHLAEHIGVDEAGRGCLAGPVVAAAVLLPAKLDIENDLPGLNDSKQLSARARDKLYPCIKRSAVWSLGIAWPREIDEVNILNATFRAMSRAVSRLRITPLPPLAIDGNHAIRSDAWHAVTSMPLPAQTPVIGGDALVPAIAAASILAKVFRDRLMVHLHSRWPGYGFANHKGYGTKAHLEAIAALGPCAAHRRTFRGVRPEERQGTLF